MKTKITILFFLLVSGWACLQCHAGLKTTNDNTLPVTPGSPADSDTLIILYHKYTGLASADSIPLWNQLRLIMHDARMIRYEVRILKKTGDLWKSRGKMELARMDYEKAMLLAESNGFTKELIESITGLHDLHFNSVDRKKTLYYVMKGIRIAERAGDKTSMAEFYSRLALYYMTSGDYKKALDMQVKTLHKYRQLNDASGIAGTLLDIGTTYTRLGQVEKSASYYLESKKYVNALAGNIHQIEVYCAIAEGYRYKRQLDSCEVYVQKAYELAETINHPLYRASVLAMMGWLAHDKGHYDRAEKYAKQSMDIALRVHFNTQLPSLYLLLKNTYIGQGDYRKAMEVYERYINNRDSLSNEGTRKAAAENEYAYNLEKKENENQWLKQQKKIQDLELRQNKYIYAGISVAVLVILFVAFLFLRQRKYKNEHLRVKLEQKLLRAQMDPHFVFNSLNSIQQFIMEERNRKAETYLFKFSTLLRTLLESNLKDSLSIKEEIVMLNSYLEMEALRFGSKFSYAVEVNENINPDQVNIPHLMLQPFVENAIWHGLLPKKGERTLKVLIEQHGTNTVRCTVDDNGVGRDASSKKAGAGGKRSMALDFVNQRIALIKKTYGIEGSLTIVDKKDEHGNGNGTTVILVLPVLKN